MVLPAETPRSAFSNPLADRKETPALRLREQAAETILLMFMGSQPLSKSPLGLELRPLVVLEMP
jgi:hypothetical protein